MEAEKKQIAILGSTGSIGTQALEVIAQHPSLFSVEVLTANNNSSLLIEQAKKFKPNVVVIKNKEKYKAVNDALFDLGIKVFCGEKSLEDVVESDNITLVLTALVGYSGLKPTIKAIKSGKNIALANKETMVCAGNIINNIAKKYNTRIIPVDSEHSAIFQCCRGEKKDDIESITLTASGGPFRDWPIEKIKNVNAEIAANHPNWSMGKKISIDSASMFNKGLEVIEANALFGLEGKNINVLIHPQSIVHAFVNFKDGSTIAQMSLPDMSTAIGFALNYPNRSYINVERMDLSNIGNLTFEEMDYERWPALCLAYEIIELQSSAGAVYNASKEEALTAFINNKIGFLDMYESVNYVINYLKGEGYFENKFLSLNEVFESDSLARKLTKNYITNKSI